MINMNISREGLAELCNYEGFCPTVYLDSVNVKTIGFGATSSDIRDLNDWPWDREITVENGISLLKKHVSKYVDGVNKVLEVPVRQHQFDALVCICYNIGIFGTSTSTFMKYVNQQRADSDVAKAMKMWNKGTVGGKRVVIKGLVNRRQREADMYVYGKYSSNMQCSLMKADNVSHKPRHVGTLSLERYL